MKPTLCIRHLITALMVALAIPQCVAQIVADPIDKIDTDSVRRAFDSGPYFGLYKDNYFIFGTAVGNQRPSKTNTNIKFQISISQRLTRSTLPWNTYLFLFYTQKCFWNVLERSMPMTDLNFNPGIGLTKPFFVKGRYVGKLTLIAEHESNGRDGAASRSWNKVTLAANVIINPQINVHGEIWIPIVDGRYNRDILNYSGIYQVGTSFSTANKRFGASVTLVKRRGWNFNYNTIVELNYRMFKKENQFFFVQYYNGYGEGLLAYKEFHSELRAGIVIKPRIFSNY